MIAFADADSLHDYLLDLNYEQGVNADVSGYDALDRPLVAWLIEVGGDETSPLAAYVGGPSAERPELVSGDLNALTYPVRITPHPAVTR